MTRDYPNEEQGRFATEQVAARYEDVVEVDEADWYDAKNVSTGTKYEVKSTHQELANGATGRFRLWEDQHRSLVAAESAEGQTAWYAFVLLDDDDRVQEIVRRKPTTVTNVIGGEWNRADHGDRDSRQHKVPWYEIIY